MHRPQDARHGSFGFESILKSRPHDEELNKVKNATNVWQTRLFLWVFVAISRRRFGSQPVRLPGSVDSSADVCSWLTAGNGPTGQRIIEYTEPVY